MNKDDDAAVFQHVELFVHNLQEPVSRPGDQPQPAAVISERNTTTQKAFFLFDRKKNKNNIQNNKLIQALTSELNVLNNLTKANISC